MIDATRAMVLQFPDWSAAAAVNEYGAEPAGPIALIHQGQVFACSAAARSSGVKTGLRLREAQSRCPALQVFPYDPVVDKRAFEPIIAAVEQIMPGVQLLDPGSCAIRAKGPARYFGSEHHAAEVLLRSVEALAAASGRIGIADGIFAAEQAARRTDRVRIIQPGASAQFLASISLDALQQPALTILLENLGLKTLGDFAALAPLNVRNRFGPDGAQAHLLARGLDPRGVAPRAPAVRLDVALDFEPPLERVDQVAFAFKTSAERFIDGLTEAGLVCTELRVQVHDDSGGHAERVWKHPRFFDADDVLDRVRWQLQGDAGHAPGKQQFGSGISSLRISPEKTDSISHHGQGLWGNGPEEQVHHGLSRVQSMLGHGAVLTAALTGGRMLARRRVLIPWGDSPEKPLSELAADHRKPWPGALPGPAPATLFREPPEVQVADRHNTAIQVDERLQLSAEPAFFTPPATDAAEFESKLSGIPRLVKAWAGPWPVHERWWEPAGECLYRFQVLDSANAAWLLLLKDGRWSAEARYD
ncbi:MAG: DNA polymerase Y family protein [Renibacterium salmoninarum]|nr:DNA polymerase Y family protein [Renibacterium salmoninarum]